MAKTRSSGRVLRCRRKSCGNADCCVDVEKAVLKSTKRETNQKAASIIKRPSTSSPICTFQRRSLTSARRIKTWRFVDLAKSNPGQYGAFGTAKWFRSWTNFIDEPGVVHQENVMIWFAQLNEIFRNSQYGNSETAKQNKTPSLRKQEKSSVQKEEESFLGKKEKLSIQKEGSPLKKEEDTPTVKKESPTVKKESPTVKKESPKIKVERRSSSSLDDEGISIQLSASTTDVSHADQADVEIPDGQYTIIDGQVIEDLTHLTRFIGDDHSAALACYQLIHAGNEGVNFGQGAEPSFEPDFGQGAETSFEPDSGVGLSFTENDDDPFLKIVLEELDKYFEGVSAEEILKMVANCQP
ncbi:Zonadhesin [Folsomia candida]|uniref:Zonadhesin n=1 Tax=Folsomia candida TaxID=158441 RepID=A0A226D0F7_FOLCA|nr:Zonadhesin [Folsomia candida]